MSSSQMACRLREAAREAKTRSLRSSAAPRLRPILQEIVEGKKKNVFEQIQSTLSGLCKFLSC